MKKHPIDLFFVSKLRNQELTPSENAWERLAVKLSENVTPEVRQRTKWTYWRAAASIAAFLLVPAIGFLLLTKDKDTRWQQESLLANQYKIDKVKEKSSVSGPKSINASKEVNTELAKLNRSLQNNILVKKKAQDQPRKYVQVQTVRISEHNSNKQLHDAFHSSEISEKGDTMSEIEAGKAEENSLLAPLITTNQVFVMRVTEPPALAKHAALVTDQSINGLPTTGLKPKLFERLSKRVKLMKHGEFQEAGLDPSLLWTRAEERASLVKK